MWSNNNSGTYTGGNSGNRRAEEAVVIDVDIPVYSYFREKEHEKIPEK